MQNDEAKVLMLSTQELVGAYWPQVEPLLASAPAAEEHPPEFIRQAVLAGQMSIFTIVQNTTVEMVVVVMPTPSPTLPAITIITVAGRNLRKYANQFWDHFKGWCYINGARAIDAYVPERLEAFMEKLGLKRETVHVRVRL